MARKSLYTIGQLAAAAQVTPRTVRFYTAEGLLPPPDARGRYALYTEGHLNRLWLIHRLKTAYLPLATIRTQLERLTDAQVRELLAEKADASEESTEEEATRQTELMRRMDTVPPQESGNAADYIAQILAATGQTSTGLLAAPPPKRRRILLVSARLREPAPASEPSMPQAPELDLRETETAATGELWRRIVLAPGVELHLRVPDSPEARARMEQVIAETKSLFSALH